MARKYLREQDIKILVRLVTESNGKQTVTENETDFGRFRRWLKRNIPNEKKRKKIINQMFKHGYANWTKVSMDNFKMYFEFMRTSSLVWK